MYTIQMKFKITLLIAVFLLQVGATFYNYTTCGSKSYLNAANLQCVNCSSNQIANTYQSVSMACQCAVGYTPSGNGACSSISNVTCGASTSTYYPLYSLSGITNTVTSCMPCAANAYTNR